MDSSSSNLKKKHQEISQQFVKITKCPNNLVTDILDRNDYDLQKAIYDYSKSHNPGEMNNYLNKLQKLSNKKIATMDTSNSSDDSEDTPKYFVGNSGSSGQNILPNINQDNDSESNKPRDAQREQLTLFNKIIRTLKINETIPSFYFNIKNSMLRQENIDDDIRMVDVYIYENGVFISSLDEFYPNEHPEFISIMNPISKGYLPELLRKRISSKDINVKLHAINTNYEPPKYMAFKGKSNKLGNLVPEFVDDIELNQKSVSPESTYKIEVDESIKVSTLRIRLLDGSVQTLNVNPTVHTLENLYNHIFHLNIPGAIFNFSLYVGHPPKKLDLNDDIKKTLSELSIENAIIIQRPS